MKKIIFPLLFATSALAQQPDVQWMLSEGGTGQESIKAIEAVGNTKVVAGTFIGQFTAGTSNVNSVSGGSDIYIIKYTDGNTIEWVKTFGNACHEQFGSVALASDGTIYVTGSFYNALSIDNNTVFSNGSKDIFLASFGTDGSLNWLKAFGGTGTDEGIDVEVDQAGNLYLGVNMDQYNFTITDQASNGVSAHVAKFDSNGNLLWSNCESGNAQSNITLNSIAVDESGKVYATGGFFGQVLAGDNGSVSLASTSDHIWAGSYDQNGITQFIYTLPQPSGNMNHATSIAVTEAGNVILCAHHTGSVNINGTSYQSTDRDVLILELSPTGTLIWGTVFVAMGLQTPETIAVNETGMVAIAGLFLDNLNIGTQTLVNQGGSDGFVFLLNQGVLSAVLQAAGTGNELVRDMVPYEDGFAAVGDFSGGATTSMNLGLMSVNSTGDQDCFVAKIAPPATTSVHDATPGMNTIEAIAYPNPARETISIRHSMQSEKAQVEIFTITGTLAGMFEMQHVPGQDMKLDISSLSPGTYQVRIADGTSIVNSRIVVQ